MRSIPWTTYATYNGRQEPLHQCLNAWRRDARRGRGALGSISIARPLQMDGWRTPMSHLGPAECLDLLAVMPNILASSEMNKTLAR